MNNQHMLVTVAVLFGCAGPALPTTNTGTLVREGADETAAGAANAAGVAAEAPNGASSSSVSEQLEDGQANGPCPSDMRLVATHFCMDVYEAALLEQLADGSTVPYPHWQLVGDHEVRATNQKGLVPAGYISADEAEAACDVSGKRLCRLEEWRTACQGPSHHPYPYGPQRIAGACNDNGRSPIQAVFPGVHVMPAPRTPAGKNVANAKAAKSNPKSKAKTRNHRSLATTTKFPRKKSRRTPHIPVGVDMSVWSKLNDPRLGQVEGSVTRSGERDQCVSEYGIFDLVGNRHEWVADETATGNGVFAGGYFLDISLNGEGCNYRTSAHARSYHDYSTGFRCCKDLVSIDDAIP